MFRYFLYAVPLLVLFLALFGFAVDVLDFEPRAGAVIRLALFETPRIPAQVVLGAWLMEATGLVALFLLVQGRTGAWWLDGLVTGWVAWIFRGPLLVITIVAATRQPQDAWWSLAFGWWVLYSVCGLALAVLARRSRLGEAAEDEDEEPAPPETVPEPAIVSGPSSDETDDGGIDDREIDDETDDGHPERPREVP